MRLVMLRYHPIARCIRLRDESGLLMSRPQFQRRSRPGLPVGVVDELRLLAAEAAAAELEGVDWVRRPLVDDFS